MYCDAFFAKMCENALEKHFVDKYSVMHFRRAGNPHDSTRKLAIRVLYLQSRNPYTCYRLFTI